MLVRRLLVLGVVGLAALVAPRAQTLPVWTADSTFTNLVEGLEDDVAGAGTEAFVPLTLREQQIFGIGIQQILNGDPLAGRSTLNQLGLEVYTFVNAAKTTDYYVVHELAAPGQPGHKGWSPVLINRKPRRNVAFIAPHVQFDSQSVRGMTQIAIAAQPRLVVLGGTHRCANSATSSCSGTTGACGGGSAPYRISDPVHVTTSAIWALYEQVIINAEIAKVVEFHTQVSGQPAAVQISNGTTKPYVPGDFTQIVRDYLDGQSDFTVLSCNKEGDPNGTFCSGTNVGGRLLNGVAPGDACTTNATTASGRWMHIEAYSSVWNSSTNRAHMQAAILAALPQDMPGGD